MPRKHVGMEFLAVIVAAGSGSRAGPGAAKQWREVAGKPVLRWSAEALLGAGASRVVVVVPADGAETAADLLSGLANWSSTPGGATRADSVMAGLKALNGADNDVVLIHDAARPFLQSRHIEDLLIALATADGAVPALRVADTLKWADTAAGPISTVPREGLWRAQTPQAFRLGPLLAAYAAWPADAEPTDDAAVAEHAGAHVVLTGGDPMLMKLTFPEDFAMAERLAGGEIGRAHV